MPESCTKVTLWDGSTAVHMPGTVWRVFSADGRRFRDFPTLELAKSSTVHHHHHFTTDPSGQIGYCRCGAYLRHGQVHTVDCDLDDDCTCR